MSRRQLQLLALQGLPLVQPGADIATIIAEALDRQAGGMQAGDVLVIAQKIISKAENRQVKLDTVIPSARAIELAAVIEKDARLIELILQESIEVVRYRRDLLIVRHRNGYVGANAGIDQSNVGSLGGGWALLLPVDPDASAQRIRAALQARYAVAVGIIVNDTAGRPWRLGVTGFALGVAGLLPLESRIGYPDLFGRPLERTEVAVADELAAAASFLMGQADEGHPVVLIRGAHTIPAEGKGTDLIRPIEHDLFR